MFPADPDGLIALLAAWHSLPARWCRPANGASCTGRSIARLGGGNPPVLYGAFEEFRAAGRPIIGLGAGRDDGTAAWLEIRGENLQRHRPKRLAAASCCRAISQDIALSAHVDRRAHHADSGYEGSELLVARLLIECGADVRYVGTVPASSGQT